MVNKSKLKDDLKSMVGDLKTAANQTNENDNELVDIYEQHSFEHSLIDYNEPVNEWNMRDILPAFPSRNCYIPIPPDCGSSVSSRGYDNKGQKIKKQY